MNRTEQIKGYLKRLGDGESLENVKKDFVKEFNDVNPIEIMEAELSGDPAGISVPGTEKRHVCAAFRISSLSGKSMAVFRSVGNGKIDSYGILEKTV